MKTIGLIGGMSWESTATYYRLLNQNINKRLGKLHSAKVVMISVDFQPIEALMKNGEWNQCATLLAAEAQKVEAAGADFLLLCTNTLHKVAEAIEQATTIPFLHIADAAAKKIKASGINTIGLLGTSFTMEDDFYRQRLEKLHNLTVLTPPSGDRAVVHQVIFDELCRGIVREESQKEYLRIIERLRRDGAQGIIEGCTEIEMLLENTTPALRLFDTTTIHAEHAVDYALSDL